MIMIIFWNTPNFVSEVSLYKYYDAKATFFAKRVGKTNMALPSYCCDYNYKVNKKDATTTSFWFIVNFEI